MKNHYYFIIALYLLSALYNSISACNIDTLSSVYQKAPLTFYLDEDGIRTIKIKVDIENFILNEVLIKEITFLDSIYVKFYEDNPCDSVGNIIDEFATADPEVTIEFKPSYKYIIIKTNSQYNGKITVMFTINQRKDECNARDNKFNSINNPLDFGDLEIGENTISSCTNECKPFNGSTYNVYTKVNRPVKWIKFSNKDFSTYLLGCNSDVNDVNALVYGIKNENTYFLKNINFIQPEENFIDLNDYQYMIIGVYSQSEDNFQFALHVRKFKNENGSCVNFFDTGHFLEVLSTSKGSPLSGPFVQGELVTYRYYIKDWMPINKNWFHGIKINYETGWQGLYLDSIENKPLVKNIDGDTIKFDSLNTNFKTDFINTDTIRPPGFDIKNLIIPSFYIKSGGKGPSGPLPNFKWGKKFDKIKSEDSPLYEVVFTLKANSSIDCNPVSANVSVTPLSDFETGIWPTPGCIEDRPLTGEYVINCCNGVYVHSFEDTIICSEVAYNFTGLTQDSCVYAYKRKGEIKYSALISFEEPLILKNTGESNDTFNIMVIWDHEVSTCIDTFYFTIIVKPEGQNIMIEINNICQNEKLNLTEAIQKKLPPKSRIDNNIIIYFDEASLEHNNVMVVPTTSVSGKINIISENTCIDSAGFSILPIACAEKRSANSFSFYVFPNVNMGQMDLIANNDTNEQYWKMTILNTNGEIIRREEIFLLAKGDSKIRLDVSELQPGAYFIKLNSKNEHYSRRFIRI